MAPVICGASYLFSILQHVLVDQPKATCLLLGPLVKLALHEWQALTSAPNTTPMPIMAQTPCAPSYIGAVDASGVGLGGFRIRTEFGQPIQPLVFHCQLPQRSPLSSFHQPTPWARSPTVTLNWLPSSLALSFLPPTFPYIMPHYGVPLTTPLPSADVPRALPPLMPSTPSYFGCLPELAMKEHFAYDLCLSLEPLICLLFSVPVSLPFGSVVP